MSNSAAPALLLLTLGGALALFATGARADDGDDVGSEPPEGPPDVGGLARLRQLGQQVGLPADVLTFLQVIAQRESGGRVNVGLGPNDHPGRPDFLRRSRGKASAQQNEANKALAAFKRMQREGTVFPGDPARWTFGSAGWFGNLVPYSRRHLGLEDPWDLGRESGSLAEGVGNLRGLMGYSGFRARPKWETLYAGWGVPDRMNDPKRIAKRRAAFIRRLQALGFPASFADQRPSARSSFPTGKQVYAKLKGVVA